MSKKPCRMMGKENIMKISKNFLKKATAITLTLAFSAQSFMTTPVFADNYGIMPLSMSDVGTLGVDITLDFPAPGEAFAIDLEATTDGTHLTHSLNATDAGTSVSDVFKQIPVGTYDMTISSDGYSNYTQEIEIKKATTTKIELYNSKKRNDNLVSAGSDKQFGVISIGDIAGNNDGVDEKDEQAMLDYLDGKTAYDVRYDLNNDGTVNVADLAYITLNKGKNVTAKPLTTVSAESIITEADDNTVVNSGNLSDLVEGIDTVVQLAPANPEAEISEANPVQVSFDLTQQGIAIDPENPDVQPAPVQPVIEGIVIKPPVGTENVITSGTVAVMGDDGQEYEFEIDNADAKPAKISLLADNMTEIKKGKAKIESDGTIVVDLGGQIAIKKVTIKVTGSSTKLVDIAEVEFLNDMESRVPEPDLNIPTNIVLTQKGAGNDPEFEITWDQQQNVEGYEVQVSGGGATQTHKTGDENVLSITKMGDAKIKTYIPYTVRVRSVNGDWKSPYSESVTITLYPYDVPPKPQYVSAVGGVESIRVSWDDMVDTQYYSIHYKADTDEEWSVIDEIRGTSYNMINMTADVSYKIYVVGHNEKGESDPSETVGATPAASLNVIMPKYKLINTSNGEGQLSAHILGTSFQADKQGAVVTGGKEGVEKDGDVVVDNNQASYVSVSDWDTGHDYYNWSLPIVQMDHDYTIDTIRFAPSSSQPYTYAGVQIRYEDENGKMAETESCELIKRADKNNNVYYTAIAPEPITSDKFQLCIKTGWGGARMVTVSEMKIYEYDDLAAKVDALYADEMHLSLVDGVNDAKLKELYDKLEETDEVSGEKHPEYETIKAELDYAKELLATPGLAEIIPVDTGITPNADSHLDCTFPLSNLQPIGITANAGDQIIIYLGSKTEKRGTRTSVTVTATQNHGEAAKWQKNCGQLVIGRNVIEIPDIANRSDHENGGSVYVEWNGGKNTREYSLRVSGGNKIPMLNVSGLEGEERESAISKYYNELVDYCKKINDIHTEKHSDRAYYNDCTANYTEIITNYAMHSVPADQVLNGVGDGGAAQLSSALTAADQQLELFYQHKGLNKNEPDDSKNRFPTQRLNTRYHTMFFGAFMYAGGKHIGIEYDSVPGVVGMKEVTSDDMGKKLSGDFAGWGIAHEIGHCINNKNYVVAEVTNNYFAMLATQQERSDFEKVYKYVTKGSIGGNADLATALAMYYQLHMFYDDYYDYKTFDNIDEQLENIFFARVDAYSRDTTLAPEKEIPLALTNGGLQDNLIRLASAAAEKNLLPFFQAWGFKANADTVAYVSQYPTEDHKIQYLDYDAWHYRLDGGKRMPADTAVTAVITTPNDGGIVNSNTVSFSLGNTAGEEMLGYEIIRNGKPVAFVPAENSTYDDVITTGNNMVYEYEVIGYDKLLNATEPVVLDPIKVKHEGNIDRDNWSITTNMKSEADIDIKAGDDSGYCEDTYESAISSIITDGKDNVAYVGKVEKESDGTAEFTVGLGGEEQVTAIKYNGGPAHFGIFVSDDSEGSSWILAKDVEYDGSGEKTIFFDQPDKADEDGPGYMYIYKTSYLRIAYYDTKANVTSLQILGPTNDDVEFIDNGIGTLKDEFVYEESSNSSIPAGSMVFTGLYKGSPSYNVVKLLDQDKNIINGSQIIMAADPQDGQLGNVSEGRWIYWIEPEDLSALEADGLVPTRVMAELYRVDNAFTLENERLVSNTLFSDVPEELPPIVLGNAGTVAVADDTDAAMAAEISDSTTEETTDVLADDSYTGGGEDVSGNISEDETVETAPDAEGGDDSSSEDTETPDVQDDEVEGSPEEIGDEVQETPDEAYDSIVSDDSAAMDDSAADEAAEIIEAMALSAAGIDAGAMALGNFFEEYNAKFAKALSENVSEGDTEGSTEDTTEITDGYIFIPIENEPAMAYMDLVLREDINSKTLALQSSFRLSDINAVNVSDVEIIWSDIVDERALLKTKSYDPETGILNVYIVADEDLIDNSNLLVGKIRILSEDNESIVNLTLRDGSIVTFYNDYTTKVWTETQGYGEFVIGEPVPEYTVSFDLGGAESESEAYNDIIVMENESVTLPAAPTREGYIFGGWSNGTDVFNAGDVVTVTSDMTFTAQWAKMADNPDNIKAELAGENGITFIAGIDNLKYKEVGFILESDGKSAKVNTNVVYTSLKGSSVKPSDLKASFVYALSITDIADAGSEIKVIPYAIKLDGTTVEKDGAVYSISSVKSGGAVSSPKTVSIDLSSAIDFDDSESAAEM